MNIQISVRRMPLSFGLEKVINESCDDISSKYDDKQTIEIYLDDTNGPHKGGCNKRCHLKVRGQNHLSVDVTEIKRDIYSAIDKAFTRLIQIIKRRISIKTSGSIKMLEDYVPIIEGDAI